MMTMRAVFGAGCFWGIQAEFDKLPGVINTEVGYMGGDETMEEVSYESVCSDITGHAEVVMVEYDPEDISYDELLEVFWENHNPTTLNRQGPDVGSQYRSVIFYYTPGQRLEAEESLKNREKKIGKKIVTEIVEAGKFYRAEEYHQKYLEKRGKDSCKI